MPEPHQQLRVFVLLKIENNKTLWLIFRTNV
jgi:hypothetical protein